MDNDTDRFRPDGPTAPGAGDDLAGIARQMEELRDYLLGLTRFAPSQAEAVTCMEVVEEQVSDMLFPKWDECQAVLRAATDRDLDEVDTTWMGEAMPRYFRNATPDSVRALARRIREPRTPTNPATLIATGAL